jgi:hypothetical protein
MLYVCKDFRGELKLSLSLETAKRSSLLRIIHSYLIGDLRDNRCYLVCNFLNMNFDFFHSRDQITLTVALFSDEVDLGRLG